MLKRKIKSHIEKWRSFISMASHFTSHVKKQKRRLFLSLLAGIVYITFGMLEPWPLKMIFDNVFYTKPYPAFVSSLESIRENKLLVLNILVASIIILAVVKGIFYYFQQILTSRAGQQIISGVRVDLYSHIQKLSFSFHDRRRTGDILARLTTDIKILRDVLVSLPLTCSSELLLMAGMLIVMLCMDWTLALLALIIVPILIVLTKKYRMPMKKAIIKQREREGDLTTLASEVLGAIKVVQGFHQESNEVEKFCSNNKNSLKSGLKATRLEAKLKWASELSVALVSAIVVGVAGRKVLSGILSPGDLLVFVYYLRNFNRPLRRISKITEQMARGTASGERVLKLMRIKPDIVDLPKAYTAPPFKGEIQYNNVCFKYSFGKVVLNNINLNIKPGEKVALIGKTGSGKSTLISLLPRFYEPSSGTITIDNNNIQNLKMKSLREQISLVFQEPVLFATTIAENIAYGKPNASFSEVEEAAKKAKIHDIIQSLQEGYDTIIGERGSTLSGGQRQCVSIARAIIKNAPIIILDEPTSGLDKESARLVMSAINELMEGKTVLIISHQAQTIQDVDTTYVIEDGNIVEEKELAMA